MIPWSRVKAVSVVNVRREDVVNRPSLIANLVLPVYKEVGDWRVMTIDGRDIVIPMWMTP